MQSLYVITMGASAGGIDALSAIVGTLPSEFPATLLVVQHLAPTSPGVIPQILDRAGPLTAVAALDGETVEPAKIYVAPPDRHLLVEEGGRLRLSRGPKENRARPAIDPLFRSAAIAFGPRLIGAVLTGYLDDGTAGLQAVKLCGGAAVVQDPKEAVVPDMPLSALQNVDVDFCLPLADIGPQLVRMVAAPAPRRASRSPDDLLTEVAISAGVRPPLDEIMQIGEASDLTCPDCHGALMRLRGDKPARFRCHTGHAFTQQALLAGLTENTENALWSAIRSLQEEAILKRHLASHLPENSAKTGELLSAADAAISAADGIRRIQESVMRRELPLE